MFAKRHVSGIFCTRNSHLCFFTGMETQIIATTIQCSKTQTWFGMNGICCGRTDQAIDYKLKYLLVLADSVTVSLQTMFVCLFQHYENNIFDFLKKHFQRYFYVLHTPNICSQNHGCEFGSCFYNPPMTVSER